MRSVTCLAAAALAFAGVLLLIGCGARSQPLADRSGSAARETIARAESPATAKDDSGRSADGVKRIPAGKNVWLEVDGKRRRVIVEAIVCLREGMLEQLMCRRRTKEHEAILSADVDARDIHKALLLTGVEPGSVVQYEPKFEPPRGPIIKVTLQYQEQGKTVAIPAQQWVRDAQKKKALEYDWVFAGSELFHNPDEPNEPPLYAANSGDVICVSNFPDAMLDLPINSPQDNAELVFEAFTEHIPPVNTVVTVTLEPMGRK